MLERNPLLELHRLRDALQEQLRAQNKRVLELQDENRRLQDQLRDLRTLLAQPFGDILQLLKDNKELDALKRNWSVLTSELRKVSMERNVWKEKAHSLAVEAVEKQGLQIKTVELKHE